MRTKSIAPEEVRLPQHKLANVISGNSPLSQGPVKIENAVPLAPLVLQPGQDNYVCSKKIQSVDGISSYPHIHFPTGEVRWIPLTKVKVGSNMAWGVSPEDATYLMQQMKQKEQCTTILDINKAIFDKLTQEERSLLGLTEINFRLIPKDILTSRLERRTDKKTSQEFTVFKFDYVSFYNNSFSSKTRDILAIRDGRDYFIPIEDGNFMVSKELYRVRAFTPASLLADLVGVTRRTVHNWIESGRIKGVLCRDEMLVHNSYVDSIIEERAGVESKNPEQMIRTIDVMRLLNVPISSYEKRVKSSDNGERVYTHEFMLPNRKVVSFRLSVYSTLNHTTYFSFSDVFGLFRTIFGHKGANSLLAQSRTRGAISFPDERTPDNSCESKSQLVVEPYPVLKTAANTVPVYNPPKDRILSADIHTLQDRSKFSVKFSNIMYADSLLSPHIDESAGAIRITERCFASNDGIRYSEIFGLGVKFKRFKNDVTGEPEIFITESAAEVIRFYIELKTGPEQGSPGLSNQALEIANLLNKGKTLDSKHIAMMWIARFGFIISENDLLEIDYLGGIFYGRNGRTTQKMFERTADLDFSDNSFLWLSDRNISTEAMLPIVDNEMNSTGFYQ